MDEELIEYLRAFISKERYDKILKALERRTEYLTVVLEDLHYSQNASSIIRHCDAFGIQNLHVIENRNTFKLKNHAVRGTLKWINLNRFNDNRENSLEAVRSLKEKGYRIIATSPRQGGKTPSEFCLEEGKAALFFGNERNGLSPEILENADDYLYVPMEGFVESLNISASCAIILQQLSERLRNTDIHWKLDDFSKKELLITWMKQSIKKIDPLMRSFKNAKES